jgi:hypothetical protein
MQNLLGSNLGLRQGGAFSSYFPSYEVTTPQYPVPNPRIIAQEGYRTNDFAYAITSTRASAKAQAGVEIYDTSEVPKKQKNVVKGFIEAGQFLTQPMFNQITQISRDIAGFCVWEVEKDNLGRPLRPWFMRPDWCSFLRGEQQPIRAVRYQPYGLPFVDVPIENCLFFTHGENFDPIYPGIKFMGWMLHALQLIQTDNAATFFLNDFFKHGAKFSGLLSVKQTIDDQVSNDLKRRWKQAYGGVGNWSDIAVLGEGAEYQSVSMNFRDMLFPELDARTEVRMCDAAQIDPIVVNAHAGLDVSSYNNKEQAERGWFYKWVKPSWNEDAKILTQQLLPMFDIDPETMECRYDTSTVYSLSESQDALFKRWVSVWEKRGCTLDELRNALSGQPVTLPPAGEGLGDSYYVTATIRSQDALTPEGDIVEEAPTTAQPQQPAPKKKPTQAEQDAADAERKHFKHFATLRIKRGAVDTLDEYEFKYLDEAEQKELKRDYVLRSMAKNLDKAVETVDG